MPRNAGHFLWEKQFLQAEYHYAIFQPIEKSAQKADTGKLLGNLP